MVSLECGCAQHAEFHAQRLGGGGKDEESGDERADDATSDHGALVIQRKRRSFGGRQRISCSSALPGFDFSSLASSVPSLSLSASLNSEAA